MNTISITDQESLSQFINDVEELHDALLHEAILVHPGYVSECGDMFGDASLPDATMIFQSQFPNFTGVRVKLREVSVFKIGFSFDFLNLSIW